MTKPFAQVRGALKRQDLVELRCKRIWLESVINELPNTVYSTEATRLLALVEPAILKLAIVRSTCTPTPAVSSFDDLLHDLNGISSEIEVARKGSDNFYAIEFLKVHPRAEFLYGSTNRWKTEGKTDCDESALLGKEGDHLIIVYWSGRSEGQQFLVSDPADPKSKALQTLWQDWKAKLIFRGEPQ